MAVLSAVFKGVDELSSIFDRMANSGARAVEQWESAGSVANTSFSQAVSGAENTAKAMSEAASSTDHWTTALGSYDKSAMEAVYTTEDLVQMGVKTQAALDAEAETARLCAQAADNLTKAIESAVSIQEEMSKASEEAARVLEQVAESDKVSAETKEELSRASENLAHASTELARAHEEAARAAEELAQITNTAGASQEEMEAAAEKAAHAAESLVSANQKATGATDELTAATAKAAEEHEKNGKSGAEAIAAIEQALVAAGLTKLLSEVTDAVIDMTNAFSEAESVIVKATGATGDQLDSLNASMMKVYANIDDADMNNTAGAIGEINTRLGLQGEELENVATLFMQYADNTNSSVVPAIQSVTKVMKNWDVEVSGTEGLLDKLTYAAQASGASVDALSDMVVTNKATLQQLGYGLDESIALLSMFEYEGLNASSIMMGFRSAITNFSSEGLDASAAMQEVIGKIGSMADESEATALAIDTFGSRAGAELAYAIRSSKFEIDDWISAIGSAEGTLAKTDEAADTLADKWTQASNSMSTAFTNVLEPVTNGISNAFAGLLGGIGNFLNKHPVLTAALIGIATALGLAAAGVAAVSAALAIKAAILPVVTALTATFGVTLSAAIWPITAIVAGVAALVAGIVMLVNWLGKSDEEFNGLTATSKQHYEQLEELNAEYERTVALEGENSEAAQKLAADIAGLEAVYESTRMTIEEFVAQNDALIESHNSLIESYQSSMDNLTKEEKSTTALVSKLEELASKTSLSAAEQQQMSAIVGKLNEEMPSLALSYDEVTGSLNQSVDAIRALAQAQAEQQRQQAQFEAYTSAITEQTLLMEQLEKAAEQTAAAQARADEIGGMGWFGESKQAKKDLEEFKAEQARLAAALDETNALLSEQEQSFAAAAAAAEEAALAQEQEATKIAALTQYAMKKAVAAVESGFMTSEKAAQYYNLNINSLNTTLEKNAEYSANLEAAAEAAGNGLLSAKQAAELYEVELLDLKDVLAGIKLEEAIEDVTSRVDELVNAYDSAYNSAYSSISGQMGLFESMTGAVSNYAKENKLSADSMLESLQSQAQYMADYTANLQAAKDLGISDALISELSDGSVQSAAYLSTIVNSSEEKIAEINKAFQGVEEGKDAFATTVAEMQTNFSEEMDTLVSELETAVGDMDLYDESKESAAKTIQGYIDGVESMLPSVQSSMASLSAVVSSYLPGTSVTVATDNRGMTAYATGTLSAEPGLALVGEEGPELVNFGGGEVVYTAAETNRILAAADNVPIDVPAPKGFDLAGSGEGAIKTTSEKKITLDIKGSGEIDIGSVDEETVWDIVAPKLKSAFMSILTQEKFEEGDLAYEF